MKNLAILFLTRAEYKDMIERYPLFMRDVWTKLQKQWSLRGVEVFVPEDRGLAHELRVNVDLIRLFRMQEALKRVIF